MVGEKLENVYYINAPAGTGKTHSIIEEIIRVSNETPHDNILCITYTNRAADELKERVAEQVVFNTEQIEIGTIHSFLHGYFKQYFSLSECLESYFSFFKNKIDAEIEKNNKRAVDDEKNRNTRYLDRLRLEKSTPVTFELIREKLKSLEYNETEFSNYYFGRLSHNDLVLFISNLVKEYPKLQKGMAQKYSHIFIDECQDTNADVLRLFYSVATHESSSTALYYYGDKMQEIYNNYDGTFENEYNRMNSSLKLHVNYRSHKEIVDMLSHLYGDDRQKHDSFKGNFGTFPTIYITSDVDAKIPEINDDYLTLRVFNRSRFERDSSLEDMSSLFDAYNKLIPYGSRKSHMNALVPVEKNSSPDYLLNLLWQVNNIIEKYAAEQYGHVIQLIKNQPKRFNSDKLSVKYHQDKKELKKLLNQITALYQEKSRQKTIGEFILELESLGFFREGTYKDVLEFELYDKTYEKVLQVPLLEFTNLVRYNQRQDISTQHGVKGEGHDNVCLVLEDSKQYQPYLYMYDFLEMFTLFDNYLLEHPTSKQHTSGFNLKDFQELQYCFSHSIMKIEEKTQKKVSEFNNADIKDNLETIFSILDNYIKNPYYSWIFGERQSRKLVDKTNKETEIDKYIKKRRAEEFIGKNIKQLLKYSEIERILTAYKLFYVGCSRSKNKLILIIDKEKIQSFQSSFIEKFEETGFVFKQ